MELKNCKKCGKVFVYAGMPLCPQCMNEIDEQFKIVRDYIYDHPGATIPEVAKETEIDEDLIFHFLREGRLELKTPGLGLTCEKCGAPIRSGRYCSKCVATVQNELHEVLNEVENDDRDKLRRLYTTDRNSKSGRKN